MGGVDLSAAAAHATGLAHQKRVPAEAGRLLGWPSTRHAHKNREAGMKGEGAAHGRARQNRQWLMARR